MVKKPSKKRKKRNLRNVFKESFRFLNRPSKVNPHKSFKRSYREDYKRETPVPGVMAHIFKSFGVIFKNWKLFLPLLIIAVGLNALFVGIMNQGDYAQYQEVLDETSMQVAGGDIGSVAKAGLLLISTVSTGGLSGDSSEAVIQCIPIFFLIVVYSAAVQTDFLATPLYALAFFIFAALMVVISAYLLSSSLIALVAVSAPGLYPLKALRTASDLMMGRRVKFILRLVALIIMLAILWVVIMMPLILFDMWMKQFEWAAGIPFVPICLATMTCFTEIYVTVYLYKYYRWMLNYKEDL